MTREHKLGLIVGFSLVLVLGVLISDHFSKARTSPPLAVEIKDPSTSPFAGNIPPPTASAPAGALPTTQPVALREPAPPPGFASGPDSRQSQALSQPARTDIVMADRPPGDRPLAGQIPLSGVSQSPITPPPTFNSALPVSSGSLKHYDVKENDNIYSIARKYYGDGNLWTKLRDYNKGKVTETGGMREGVALDIPPKDVLDGKARLADPGAPAKPSPDTAAHPPDIAAGKPDPKSDPKAAGYATYTVQEGDTLYSIARKRLGSTKRVQDLIDANKGTLSSPDELKVGMSIRIPAR